MDFWSARSTKQKVLIGTLAILGALVVGGALLDTGSDETTSSAVETVTVTETLAGASTPSSAGQTAQATPTKNQATPTKKTNSKSREVSRVPDVTGDRLDVAQSKLDDLHISYKVIGGGTFGVVVPSNWMVCDQSPASGTRSRSVKLIVDRPGDCGGAAQATGSGSSDRLPDLRGLRLDVAEDQLEDLGIVYEEIGGGLFGIIDTSNWEVCDQDPGPGTASQRVKLIVERPGEC